MPHPPDLSPRAQAILRAIENETQARRQRSETSVGSSSDQPAREASATAPPAADSGDQLTRLVDHVVAQTEEMRAQFTDVEQSLDTFSRALAGDVPHEPAPTADADQRGGARLIAIELALSGASRGEVSTHLARELSVSDWEPLLDDVFGAGSADSARMPWGG